MSVLTTYIPLTPGCGWWGGAGALQWVTPVASVDRSEQLRFTLKHYCNRIAITITYTTQSCFNNNELVRSTLPRNPYHQFL